MKTETITIAGHQVKYINETGDKIDEVQLQECIEIGDIEGTLYWKDTIMPIGKWWIVDWKDIADRLYEALCGLPNTDKSYKACEKYEQAIENK